MSRIASSIYQTDTGPLIPGAEPFLYEAGEVGCLLVHGFTSTPGEMRELGRYLADRGITAGAPLLPGHGTTCEDLRGKTWRDWYGVVSDALDDILSRCRRVYMAGLSLGGALTLYTAARRGADLAGIVTMSAPIYLPRGLAFACRRLHNRIPYVKKLYRDIQDPVAKEEHASYMQLSVDATASLIDLLSLVRAGLPRVKTPALIIYSRHDHVVHPASSRYIYSRLGSTRKRILALDRGFHIVTVDRDKGKVYSSIYRFIGKRYHFMLRAVLFDLGSTLQEYQLEDWAAITAELNRELYRYIDSQGHAHRLPPLDEFLEIINARVDARWAQARDTLHSESMIDVLTKLFSEHGIEDMRAEECLLPWYNRLTDIGYIEPDVKPTLERLREGGLKLGLVSNTAWPAAAHDPDLERFGIKDLLDCRIHSCEVGWEKPAPQIFEAALQCMGTRPEETAFVGDFLRYDIAGAHGVGMKGIWKRVEGRPEEIDDHTIRPDATISRLSEVPRVLEELYGWRGE